MATGPDPQVQITIRFNEQRVVIYASPSDRADAIIRKAAAALKENPAGLQLLYQGTAVPDDAKVKDALPSKVTVIHLTYKSERPRVSTQELINLGVNKPKEPLYGFCTDCKGLVTARPVFTCRNCKTKGQFERDVATPVDYHSHNIPPHLLTGTCNRCHQEVQPSVTFDCTSCDDGPIAPLRLIRENSHEVPCMKCGLRSQEVMTFPCSSCHCMCLECFGNLCKQGLGVGTFQQFEEVGYSIGCPGTGDDCNTSPVLDPHHFCVVDNRGPFYDKYKELSLANFEPSGDSILCKCKKEIDPTQGKEVPVVNPNEDEVVISGLRWYQRLFRSQPKKSPPKTRRRTSCRSCSVMYCMECKQVWHEGKCVPVTKELEELEKSFPIDPAMAREARWPKEQ